MLAGQSFYDCVAKSLVDPLDVSAEGHEQSVLLLQWHRQQQEHRRWKANHIIQDQTEKQIV